MATENKRLNVNPILWSTADKTFVPALGEIWYYYETAGSILSVVGDGTSTVQELRDGEYITQVDNLGLSAGRTAFQELTSGTLSASGWYTIAELPSGGQYKAMAASFTCSYIQGQLTFNVGLGNRGSLTKEQYINTVGFSGGARDGNSTVRNARIAQSDTVTTSGAKIQVYIEATSNGSIETLMSRNTGSDSSVNATIALITPYLDDTPTLPDGVTTATFIEAGAEFDLDVPNGSRVIGTFAGHKTSADIMTCYVNWDEIPKQGTGLSITLPSGALTFVDSTNISSTITGFTISNFNISGKSVQFQINQTGAFPTLTTGRASFAKVSGTGCKLTITG